MEYIKWKDEDGIFEIVLNRSEAYNALNEKMLEELNEALRVAEESESLLLLVRGSGKGFSAGGDIKMMLSSGDQDSSARVIDTISEIAVKLYSLSLIHI